MSFKKHATNTNGIQGRMPSKLEKILLKTGKLSSLLNKYKGRNSETWECKIHERIAMTQKPLSELYHYLYICTYGEQKTIEKLNG
jgi:hypothetical protein